MILDCNVTIIIKRKKLEYLNQLISQYEINKLIIQNLCIYVNLHM